MIRQTTHTYSHVLSLSLSLYTHTLRTHFQTARAPGGKETRHFFPRRRVDRRAKTLTPTSARDCRAHPQPSATDAST